MAVTAEKTENQLDILPLSYSELGDTLTGSGYSVSEMFIFGAFTVKIHDTYPKSADQEMEYLDRDFAMPITVTFVPEEANLTLSDWCFGYYKDALWTCENDLELNLDGNYITSFSHTGSFAVLYRIPVVIQKGMSEHYRRQVGSRTVDHAGHRLFDSDGRVFAGVASSSVLLRTPVSLQNEATNGAANDQEECRSGEESGE